MVPIFGFNVVPSHASSAHQFREPLQRLHVSRYGDSSANPTETGLFRSGHPRWTFFFDSLSNGRCRLGFIFLDRLGQTQISPRVISFFNRSPLVHPFGNSCGLLGLWRNGPHLLGTIFIKILYWTKPLGGALCLGIFISKLS